MKYSVVKETDKTHLKIHTIREEIIPDSTTAMTWDVMEWGFQMKLAKEVPVFITRYLQEYLQRLYKGDIKNAIFAVHPGGPKILMYVQRLLGLTDQQMQYSYQILKEYGNMSSATLPHIWQRILNDDSVKNGTPVISLAFGPGLSICGAVMEKVCGS
jgi:predicted naringenin-chalcone synthase